MAKCIAKKEEGEEICSPLTVSIPNRYIEDNTTAREELE